MALDRKDIRAKFRRQAKELVCLKNCHDLVLEKSKSNDSKVGKARDLSLLEWLCNHKYTDLYTIQEKITLNPHVGNVYKQLAYLQKKGFIKKIKVKGNVVYRISKKGVAYFNNEMSSDYSENIVTSKRSGFLYSHTMIVQHAFYDHWLLSASTPYFISEYRFSALQSFVDEFEVKISKYPDFLIFMDDENGDECSIAIEVEIEAKKTPQMSLAFYGCDQLVTQTIADFVHYCFIKENTKKAYMPYLLGKKVVYQYGKDEQILQIGKEKLTRELTDLKSSLHVRGIFSEKGDDFETKRYVDTDNREITSRSKPNVKNDFLSKWIESAEEAFNKPLSSEFEKIKKFFDENILFDRGRLLSLPKIQRKLIADLLLLPDRLDYDSEIINKFCLSLGDVVVEPELEPELEPEKELIVKKHIPGRKKGMWDVDKIIK